MVRDMKINFCPPKKLEGEAAESARAKLCEVGLKLFAEKGFDGVSTRDLAKAAGVNISLISYYFGGKEGLYKQVIMNFAEEAKQQLIILFSSYDEAKLSKESYVTFMRGLITALVHFKAQNMDMSKLLMREMLEGMPFAGEVYDKLFDSMARQVIDMMVAAQSKKIMRADIDAYVHFFSLAHAAEFYFMGMQCKTTLTQHCSQRSKEQIIDQFNKVFIEGVLL